MRWTFALAAIVFGLVSPTGLLSQSQAGPLQGKGVLPYGAYDFTQFGGVNLANGNLAINIPLLDYKQAGNLPDITLNFVSDSLTWNVYDGGSGQIWEPQTDYYGNLPVSRLLWSVEDMYENEALIYDSGQQDQTGYEYYLYYNGIADVMGVTHLVAGSASANGSFETVDGSGLSVTNDYETITDRKGNTSPGDGSALIERDVLGNQVQQNGSTITDSVGRSIPLSMTGTSNGCAAASFPGPPPGGTVSLTVCSSGHTVATHFGDGNFAEYQNTIYLIDSIQLPNGRSWGFQYNTYGDISNVTMPTGGSVSFQWETYWLASGLYPLGRRVTSRTLNDANGHSYTWTYRYQVGPRYMNVMTDPLGNDTATPWDPTGGGGSTEHYAGSYSEPSIGSVCSGFPAASNLLKVDYRDTVASGFVYQNLAQPGAVPTGTRTYWPGSGSLSGVQAHLDFSRTYVDYQYENVNQNPVTENYTTSSAIEMDEYDFGHCALGTPIRKTSNTYLWQSGSAQYNNANLLDPISLSTTYDATATAVAQTQTTYDESTYLSAGGTGFGLPTSRTSGLTDSQSTSHAYYTTGASNSGANPNGTMSSSVDGRGNTTTYTYQCSGTAPLSFTNALNQATSFGYDCGSSLLTSMTDANQQTVSYGYTNMGDAQSASYPDGGNTQVNYGAYAVPLTITTTTKETASQNIVQSVHYDGLARPIYSIAADGSRTDTSYNALNQVVSVTNPYASGGSASAWTTYSYDPLGRRTMQCQPDNGSGASCSAGTSYLQWVFADTGVNQRDEVGSVRQLTYDGLGRMTKVLEPSANPGGPTPETDYAYNAFDEQTSITQQGVSGESQRVRTFKYNSLGRLLWEIHPETGLTCYGHSTGGSTGCQADGYDGNGNVQYKTDALGTLTAYSYDALNRITRKDYTVGTGVQSTPSDEFEYDQTNIWGAQCGVDTNFTPCYNIGHLTHVFTSDFLAQSTLGYDQMGRVNLKSTCIAALCGTDRIDQHYLYDLAGMSTSSEFGYDVSRSLPWGGVGYSYDSAGRLNQVTKIFDTPETYTSASATNMLYGATSFDVVGPTSSYVVSGGTTYSETSAHDNRLRQYTYGVQGPSSQTVYSWNLGFYPNSNVHTSGDAVNGTWAYSYDGMSRLSSGQSSALGATWSYDSFGNRLSQTMTAGSGVQYTFSYSVNNQANQTPCFDSDGEQTGTGPCQILAYNGAGRIVAAPNGATYEYDSLGNRAATYMNGVFRNGYIYDLAGHVVTVLDSSYHATQREAYVGSRHLGTFSGETSVVGSSATTGAPLVLAFTDWVGTERARADTSGNLCQSTTSLPYGDSSNSSGSCSPTTTFFTGKQRDSESGLDYFGARYYSSPFAHFATPDPSGLQFADPTDPQSLNLYAYVRNNPIRFIDPTGLSLCDQGASPTASRTAIAAVVNLFCWMSSLSTGSSSDPSAGGGGGGGGGSPTDGAARMRYVPAAYVAPSNPKCSTAIMQPQYTSIFGQMGNQLKISPLFVMSTALQESGWNLAHVYGTNSSSHGQPLNNLFGMTNAGGNNIAYPSVQASAQAWIADWGSYLSGQPQTIQAYAAALNSNPNHMYNSNPAYPGQLAARYKQLVSATAACGTTF